MTRHTTRALLGTGALLITGVLALTACGSGFDDGGGGGTDNGDATELTSSDDALTILIGSSGDAETAAVEEAVAAWSMRATGGQYLSGSMPDGKAPSSRV